MLTRTKNTSRVRITIGRHVQYIKLIIITNKLIMIVDMFVFTDEELSFTFFDYRRNPKICFPL